MPANGTRSAQQFVPPRLAGPMHSTAPCPYQQGMSNAHQRTYQRRSLGARGDASLPWPARRYRPAPPHCVSRQVRSLLPPRAQVENPPNLQTPGLAVPPLDPVYVGPGRVDWPEAAMEPSLWKATGTLEGEMAFQSQAHARATHAKCPAWRWDLRVVFYHKGSLQCMVP
ncbi:hypothetical protein A9Z42_0042890 [Trichoderma parareesei]|uniref:Uncharacterized protein n=1 Tax=Trichoderma parareesei TaxID=858221 RepID=A0A2H2ZX45_TRIPA|nr:hypothetical protein A9Z42_0042890 [Trichoderma parareesei]